MSWGRRTTTHCLWGLLAVTTTSLAGCGGGEPTAAPTPVVIPGSTVTIGTDASAPLATVDPTTEPTSDSTGSTDPTDPTDPTSASTDGDVASADDLLARVGGAMGTFETVHLSVGDDTAPPVVEADHQYLPQGSNDFDAVFTGVPGRTIDALRVDGTVYVKVAPSTTYSEVPSTSDDGSVIGALPDWDVLGDLLAVLQNASGFVAGGPTDVDGTTVDSYTWTVDAADLVDGAQVPDDLTGSVDVTFSIDDTGLPVRVDESFVDSDQLLRTDYGDWGVTVDLTAPEVG